MKVLLSSLLLLCASCSQLPFAADEGLPIYWGTRVGHDQYISVEGQVPLYLWGIITPPDKISLNQAFAKEGALSVSKLSLSEDGGWDVWWPRIITFGMYWPVKWRAEAYVQKSKLPEFEQ